MSYSKVTDNPLTTDDNTSEAGDDDYDSLTNIKDESVDSMHADESNAPKVSNDLNTSQIADGVTTHESNDTNSLPPNNESIVTDNVSNFGGKTRKKKRNGKRETIKKKKRKGKIVTIKKKKRKGKTVKTRKKKRKQTGGLTRIGTGIGSNCYDPNYSIYNTNLTNLFPYKP
jgi:hypothetical protein